MKAKGGDGYVAVLQWDDGKLAVHEDDCGRVFTFDTPEKAEADGRLEVECYSKGALKYIGTLLLPEFKDDGR